MTVRGRVVDATDKSPVEGAQVAFQERNWRPGVYGTATTDAGGQFTVVGAELPLLYERCWGIGVRVDERWWRSIE